MEIIKFTQEHLQEADALARENYEEERKHIAILPDVNQLPDLTKFTKNDFSFVAIENGKLIGFLCFLKGFENAFGTTGVKGTFSPIHAHGTVIENREKIYKSLYQVAAENLANRNIVSHAIALYAHDTEAIKAFFIYGSGLRTIDSIRDMQTIPAIQENDFEYCEIKKEEENLVTPLRYLLCAHGAKSPSFMKFTDEYIETWVERSIKQDTRIFVAKQQQKVFAFIEVADDSETYISKAKGMKNIVKAFCLPEYRGNGVMQNLLNLIINILKNDGYTHLGVDFESFNPTGNAFWSKYFTPYTNGLVRRIDGHT